MREEWNLVGSLDLGGGGRHDLVDIADVLRHRSRIERRLIELAHDLFRGELGVWAVVPFDHQRASPSSRPPYGPHRRDRVIEPPI
jgi:hypothetical protein